MDGYGQFCPIAKAAEVVCERWTPLILRELLVGSTRFNEIHRGVPNCSPALLSKRLKELERAGILDRVVQGRSVAYRLTDAGRELFPVILGLGEWGQRWARTDYRPDDLDPGLLLWDVRRNLRPGGLGSGTTTVEFVFPALPSTRRFFWLVVDDRDVDLCVTDPGRDVDLVVEADLRTLTEVWLGDTEFVDAVADHRIAVSGPSGLTRRFPSWFGEHPNFARIPAGRRHGSATTELGSAAVAMDG